MNLEFTSENTWVNAVGFQVIWWLAALYQEKAVYFIAVLILLHFVFLKDKRKTEFVFVIIVSCIGIFMDSLLFNLGFFSFDKPLYLNPLTIPLWLILLWLAFASTLNHCLAWLFKNKLVSFAVGGIGGALSFVAAFNLGALKLNSPLLQSFITLFFIWGGFFLVLKFIRYKLYSGKGVL